MAHLPTQPILIIDDEEAIVIDDESEGEIEILEHGELQTFLPLLPPVPLRPLDGQLAVIEEFQLKSKESKATLKDSFVVLESHRIWPMQQGYVSLPCNSSAKYYK